MHTAQIWLLIFTLFAVCSRVRRRIRHDSIITEHNPGSQLRSVNSRRTRRSARNTLTAAAAACALLGTAAVLAGSPASASARPSSDSGAALRAALRADLTHYLTTRHKAEHISAVSLRITHPGHTPAISLAAGTARFTTARLISYAAGVPLTPTGPVYQPLQKQAPLTRPFSRSSLS
jgi:hypothetical protein